MICDNLRITVQTVKNSIWIRSGFRHGFENENRLENLQDLGLISQSDSLSHLTRFIMHVEACNGQAYTGKGIVHFRDPTHLKRMAIQECGYGNCWSCQLCVQSGRPKD